MFNNLKVPNQTNQIQTQIMIERRHPLFAVTQVTRKVQDKHVHLMTARASTLKKTEHDRTGTPVVCRDASHAQEASQTRSSQESTNVCRDASHAQGREQSMLNEVNIDFRILGLPHSAVKKAENSRVRELVKKMENHPHRHAPQRDLQQKKAYNPLSTTTKKMIQDVGNVELFQLFETDPETQCKESLSYWSEGIVYCTCRHLFKQIVANRGFNEYTLDFLSIPEYVIKKG